MFNLPVNTQLDKPQQIPKVALFNSFNMSTTEKAQINKDISKIYITNEFTQNRTNIPPGEEIQSFYVIHIVVKTKDYDDKSIIKIAKSIPQNLLIAIIFDNEVTLATYCVKLIKTQWISQDSCTIKIQGSNLDQVWQNIIKDIEGGTWQNDLSIEENISLHQQQEKIQKQIQQLQKQARRETNPRKKFDLVQKANKLKETLT